MTTTDIAATAPDEPVPLDEAEARRLTDQIKVSAAVLWELIIAAYQRRAWAALGYESWDAYAIAEFGDTRLRLPREERAEIVTSLRHAGLSIRAIESATGASKDTIRKDIEAYQPGTPDQSEAKTVGTDGKQYAKRSTVVGMPRKGKAKAADQPAPVPETTAAETKPEPAAPQPESRLKPRNGWCSDNDGWKHGYKMASDSLRNLTGNPTLTQLKQLEGLLTRTLQKVRKLESQFAQPTSKTN